VWPDLDSLSAHWSTAAMFEPAMNRAQRGALIAGWQQALARALNPAH